MLESTREPSAVHMHMYDHLFRT